VHALGELTVVRCHLRDAVEGRLQISAFLAPFLPMARSSPLRAFIAARSSALKPLDPVLAVLGGILGLLLHGLPSISRLRRGPTAALLDS